MRSETPAPVVVPPVTILTGAMGEGKSLFCRALLAHDGVCGIYSPACESTPGARYGIDVVVEPGGERFALARVVDTEIVHKRGRRGRDASYSLVAPPESETFDEQTIAEGVRVGPFLFSSAAISRAAEALPRLARAPETRLVVVDEVGPLELERGGGFLEPLRELLRGSLEIPGCPLLVVVRPSLVVPLIGVIEQERPGCTPETCTTRDFPNPGDARILPALLGE